MRGGIDATWRWMCFARDTGDCIAANAALATLAGLQRAAVRQASNLAITEAEAALA